jgi:hypothetical protein
MRGLGALSAEERPQVGKVANEIKEALTRAWPNAPKNCGRRG